VLATLDPRDAEAASLSTHLLLSWARVSAQRRVLELGLIFTQVQPQYQDSQGNRM